MGTVERKRLIFKKEYAADIISGKKTSTVRMTSSLKAGDEVELYAGGIWLGTAKIKEVEVKKVRELTDEDALRDGFSNRDELVKTLKKIYGNRGLSESTEVKLIRFRLRRDSEEGQ